MLMLKSTHDAAVKKTKIAKPRQIAELVSKGVVLETYGETSQTELQEGRVNGEAG
jgi:hypothetical protein